MVVFKTIMLFFLLCAALWWQIERCGGPLFAQAQNYPFTAITFSSKNQNNWPRWFKILPKTKQNLKLPKPLKICQSRKFFPIWSHWIFSFARSNKLTRPLPNLLMLDDVFGLSDDVVVGVNRDAVIYDDKVLLVTDIQLNFWTNCKIGWYDL